MKKFYVSWGKHSGIVLAATPVSSCIKFFQRVLSNHPEKDTIGKFFRVSERGLNYHSDDEIFDAGMIIRLIGLSNEYEEQK